MINIEQQEDVFITIGNILSKKISVYAIGGTAMMLRNIKDSTLDIDLVFDKKNDRNEFIMALEKLGAKKSDATLVYSSKDNIPLMLELGNVRFDLFMNKIITSIFSEDMKKRSREIHEFGKNLIIKVADIHDIIIMKSVTSRLKDLNDISFILNKNPIDWEIIINEAKNQIDLGNEIAVLSLGEKLEKLNNQKTFGVSISREVLDKLWKVLKEQSRKQTAKKAKNQLKEP